MPSDLEVAQRTGPRPIGQIAEQFGLQEDELQLYGPYKAKVQLEVLERLKDAPNGKYVLVTAITPTPLGEGKTTTAVGLGQAFGHLGLRACVCLRQPSQGPTFGIKGGGAGGGFSQVIPMEDLNLHLTGDIHAVTAANNLLAAAIEARIYHEARQTDEQLFNRLLPAGRNGGRRLAAGLRQRMERLGLNAADPDGWSAEERRRLVRLDLDPRRVTWQRVIDTNDRFLREVTVGQGEHEGGFERRTGFAISVASELMAILALADGLADLRRRIGRIVVGLSRAGEPVSAEDLGVAGAMAVLMVDTVKPTLLQTLEHTPVLVHAGPFANIAHGNSSILADRIALKLSEIVITEAGFGSEIGMEKFFDIKCRASGLFPDAIVLVTTVRALKMHGGGPKVTAGEPLDPVYTREDLDLLSRGLPNLQHHLRVIQRFGVPAIVAINHFREDSEPEIDLLRQAALRAGATAAVASTHFRDGGAGAVELARSVLEAAGRPSEPRFLYPLEDSIEQKIEAICTRAYGADGVDYSPVAREQIEIYTRLGYDRLPICLAKTPLSLSHDPALKGVPAGFRVPIREVRAAVGAGYLYPMAGEIQTMPGLPTRPAFYDIDLDPDSGKITGLA